MALTKLFLPFSHYHLLLIDHGPSHTARGLDPRYRRSIVNTTLSSYVVVTFFNRTALPGKYVLNNNHGATKVGNHGGQNVQLKDGNVYTVAVRAAVRKVCAGLLL